MNGSMSFEIDRGSALFRVTCKGMCTPEQARAHFEEIGRAFRAERAAKRGLFVLVDVREASIQTAETAEAIREGTDTVHSQADCVAFLCASKLHAMQLRRGVQMPAMAVFEDMEQALAWIAARRTAAA
jgi:hypothetical protein